MSGEHGGYSGYPEGTGPDRCEAFPDGKVELVADVRPTIAPDTRPFYRTKTFWTAVFGAVGVIGTAWSFAIDASPIAKALWATFTGLLAVLEVAFVGDRIKRVSGGKPTRKPTERAPSGLDDFCTR